MKYSKELIEEIASHIEAGNSRADACTLSNITFETFNQWMNGKIPKQILDDCKDHIEYKRRATEFSESIKKAEAKNKARLLSTIQLASIKQWQAGAWILERKYSDEWGQKIKLDVGGQMDIKRATETQKKLVKEYLIKEGRK